MTINVKFFASLREQIGKGDDSIPYQDGMTVTRVWKLTTGSNPMPENTLCAINMEYVDKQQTVTDGDEVAFFPPVTGGEYGR